MSEPIGPARRAPPFLNLPTAALYLPVALIVAHGVMEILPKELRVDLLSALTLSPNRFWQTGGPEFIFPPYESLWLAGLPLIGSVFLHVDWFHVLTNAVFIVAFGGYLLRHSVSAYIWVSLVAAIGGSLAFLFAFLDGGPNAVGASGLASGLIAASALVWLANKAARRRTVVLAKDFAVVSFAFLLFNLFFGLGGSEGGVAWQAHLGGYVAGTFALKIYELLAIR